MNKYTVTIMAMLVAGTTGVAVKAQQIQVTDICDVAPHLAQCKQPRIVLPQRQLPNPTVPTVPNRIPSIVPSSAQCAAQAECTTLPYAGCASGYACTDERSTSTVNTWSCRPSRCAPERSQNVCELQGAEFRGFVDAAGNYRCEYAG